MVGAIYGVALPPPRGCGYIKVYQCYEMSLPCMFKSLRHCEACTQAVAIYHSTMVDSHGRLRSLGMTCLDMLWSRVYKSIPVMVGLSKVLCSLSCLRVYKSIPVRLRVKPFEELFPFSFVGI